MQMFRQTIVARQIIRRNNLTAVCGEEIDCCLAGTPCQNRIEIAVDILHICTLTTQKCNGLPTHEQRVHQALIAADKIVNLA